MGLVLDFLNFFCYMGLTPCKAEQTLQDMELQEEDRWKAYRKVDGEELSKIKISISSRL